MVIFKNQTGFAPIFIVLAIIGVVGIGGGTYLVIKQQTGLKSNSNVNTNLPNLNIPDFNQQEFDTVGTEAASLKPTTSPSAPSVPNAFDRIKQRGTTSTPKPTVKPATITKPTLTPTPNSNSNVSNSCTNPPSSGNTYSANVNGGSVELSPSVKVVNKGDSFELELKYNISGFSASGIDAVIKFDNTRLNITNSSFAYQAVPPNDFQSKTIKNDQGEVSMSDLRGAGISGEGKMATIQFKVLDSASSGTTEIKFDFDPGDWQKTNDSNIVVGTSEKLTKVTNAVIAIGSEYCR